ncbi:hypothetical protein VTO42DRAFT_2286 [Malbranchea cinnamomea]
MDPTRPEPRDVDIVGRVVQNAAEQEHQRREPVKTEPVHVDIRASRDGEEPTEEEQATLQKVAGPLPWSAFLVAVVELAERFTYYGVNGPFQNYMQHPYRNPSGVPGAIGLGQSRATGLSNFFQLWCYITSVLGGIVADQYLGKYNALVVFATAYLIGVIILFVTSLPVAIEHGASLGGLITAMIIIGLGTGGIKANISPLIAEQVKVQKPFVKTLKSGKRVIIDPSRTVERVYMMFYWCINVGGLSAIATTELELHIGFWSAYLLPLCMFVVGFIVLIAGRKLYVVRPPKGSIVVNAFRVIWIGLKHRGNMEAAKPSYQQEHHGNHSRPWDDRFVEELRRALVACRIFVYYPIYWVCYQQMLNNFISQAGTMELHGIPNDIMQNINPLTIIIFIPICDRIGYPLLRKAGIKFHPITRITMGYFVAALAMAYAAICQKLIYNSPPCYDEPMACPASNNGELPNQIHVAVQTPVYLLTGLSEIFTSITGFEYAFTKAPPSMKSFVTALFLLTYAGGAALGIALSPVAKDPKLLWMYTGLACATTVAGTIFWLLFHRYNDTEEQMNALEMEQREDEKAIPANRIGVSRRQDVGA